jgi:hypothetical protein
MIGCLYHSGSGVLTYVGKVSCQSFKEFEFGAKVEKVEQGWLCQFGVWKDGVLVRSMTSLEIGQLKKDIQGIGFIFGPEI